MWPGMVEVRKNSQESSWVRRETKKMTNCRGRWSLILVEVAGIEPASRTPPDCRNYNHAYSMEPDCFLFKALCKTRNSIRFLIGNKRLLVVPEKAGNRSKCAKRVWANDYPLDSGSSRNDQSRRASLFGVADVHCQSSFELSTELTSRN